MPFAGILTVVAIWILAMPVALAVILVVANQRRWIVALAQAYLFLVVANWTFLIVIPSGFLPLDFLLGALLPPLFTAGFIWDAWHIGFYGACFAATFLTVISLIVSVRLRGLWAAIVPCIFGVVTIMSALWFQGWISDRTLLKKAALIDATCVEINGFVRSFSNMSYFDNQPFFTSYHGVARANNNWYIWSYQARNWVPLKPANAKVPLTCD